VGEKVTNPVSGDEIMLLPASFVDSDSGSGIVMSVPAHAPYDWISLEDLKNSQIHLKNTVSILKKSNQLNLKL